MKGDDKKVWVNITCIKYEVYLYTTYTQDLFLKTTLSTIEYSQEMILSSIHGKSILLKSSLSQLQEEALELLHPYTRMFHIRISIYSDEFLVPDI